VYFEEWDEPMISGIGWVSELIEAAGGEDCFPELAAQPLGRDRILVDPLEVARRAPDIILGVYTPDELQDGVDYAGGQPISTPRATPAQIAVNAAESSRPARTQAHDQIITRLEGVARNLGFEPFKEEWSKLSRDDRAAIGLNERNRIGALAGMPAEPQSHDELPPAEDGQREPGADDE